jgi:hypothetical protein
MTPEYRRTFVGEGVNTQQQGNDTLRHSCALCSRIDFFLDELLRTTNLEVNLCVDSTDPFANLTYF